ncbi:MAG: ubiquinol-cytochrome c reductase iron-sulfur subunit [Alphaproteobacteria bacterium]|nr:ubiquinol-cytochrome c reductase iron-sulfur subunit [Alphaproteobacteria bacterium]
MTMNTIGVPQGGEEEEVKRRDFLVVAGNAFAAVGAAATLWPFIDSMNPSSDVSALASTQIDLGPIALGQRITVMWQGKPVFIDHRTSNQIALAKADDGNAGLIDPATDASRVQREDWLIMIGVCTHLGCIPLGQKSGDPLGQWSGWFCPCHGSHYDTAGRIRKGPAPRNLDLPPYKFITDTIVQIG